jgi:hypothetical protein
MNTDKCFICNKSIADGKILINIAVEGLSDRYICIDCKDKNKNVDTFSKNRGLQFMTKAAYDFLVYKQKEAEKSCMLLIPIFMEYGTDFIKEFSYLW